MNFQYKETVFLVCLSTAPAVATGCIFFSLYPDLDNIGSSANTRTDGYGVRRAVVNTGTAFHAGIKINNMGLVPPHFKNSLRTDFRAQAAPDTFFFIKYQG
jgi:hypothetical protein